MSRRVARRRGQRKLQRVGRAERRAAQAELEATLQAEIADVVQRVVEQALADEVTALVGRERYERRQVATPERTTAVCSGCQIGWATRLWRAGSYERTLLTIPAAVRVRVPRVSCICGSTVRVEFTTIAPYERSWGDVQAWAREVSGLCLSLADIREVVAHENGRTLARSTVNGWVHQVADLAEALRQAPVTRVPPVVMLDGVWGTTDRAEIQRRRQHFRATWRDREPAAVATLDRLFPKTLAYLDALAHARERQEVWQPRCLRATSILERFNRAIRQKARQAGAFHSERGLAAALALVVTHRRRLPDQPDDAPWTQTLEARLLSA